MKRKEVTKYEYSTGRKCPQCNSDLYEDEYGETYCENCCYIEYSA